MDDNAPVRTLEARGVAVRNRHRTLLEPTSLTVQSGQISVAYGDPGHGHTALALVLAGRLKPDRGSVAIGGIAAPKARQGTVALVDVPGVSEPDPRNKLSTIVGEELAMAGYPAQRTKVKSWLREQGYADFAKERMEDLPGAVRIAVLARLAALRDDVAFAVMTLPELHGGLPEWWLETARVLTDENIGVLVTTSTSVAANLVDIPTYPLGAAATEAEDQA
jgi:ABC-type transport system involved in cytochrome c biogenesis ATPase subunit